jgi:hypothetical protein
MCLELLSRKYKAVEATRQTEAAGLLSLSDIDYFQNCMNDVCASLNKSFETYCEM